MEIKQRDPVKAELKRYIYNSPNPDLKVLSIMKHINSNTINRPEFALLRELALVKQVTYLKQRLGCISLKDGKLQEGIKYFNASPQFSVDALKNASRGEFVVTNIVDARRKQRYKIAKDLYFWFACSVWLAVGALILGKLLSIWL
jgi:hypothetical protein